MIEFRWLEGEISGVKYRKLQYRFLFGPTLIGSGDIVLHVLKPEQLEWLDVPTVVDLTCTRALDLQWGENKRDGEQHFEWHAPCGCAYHPQPGPHVHPCMSHTAKGGLFQKLEELRDYMDRVQAGLIIQEYSDRTDNSVYQKCAAWLKDKLSDLIEEHRA